jgi:hypothetical protein
LIVRRSSFFLHRSSFIVHRSSFIVHRSSSQLPSHPMTDILGLDSLVAQMVLGLGAALVLGNGFAWFKERRGERPAGETGQFHRGRAAFLMVVGVLMVAWGLGSLLA